MKNLEKTLKQAYLFIKNTIQESFIKSRNSNTTTVLRTFNLQEQPYTIYFPGQQSDTAVYKYQDRPMVCHNCHNYGHTKTRCRRKGVKQICREVDHTSNKTNKSPNETRCPNCEAGNMAGSNNCEIEIKERVIKKMQADSRVGRRRALQILAGADESLRSNPQSYPTHFRCKMDPENKRKFNPWVIENIFAQEIGSKPGLP